MEGRDSHEGLQGVHKQDEKGKEEEDKGNNGCSKRRSEVERGDL